MSKTLDIIIRARDAANATLKKINASIVRLNVSGKAFRSTIAGMNTGSSQFLGTLSRLATVIGGVDIFRRAISSGFSFNNTIEKSRIGLGALVRTFNDITDAQGNFVNGTQAYEKSMAVAERIQKRLQIEGLKTVATYEELLRALQEGVGPAFKAGFNDVQVVKFTSQMTQAAAALSLPMDQLGQEIRAILDGTIDRNARIAKALGLTNAKIKELTASGKLFEYLNGKLKEFEKAGAETAKTFSGAWSNTIDAIQMALGRGLENSFKGTTNFLLKLRDAIVTIDEEAGTFTFNKKITSALKQVDAAIVNILSSKGDINEWVGDVTQGFSNVAVMALRMADGLLKVVNALGQTFKFKDLLLGLAGGKMGAAVGSLLGPIGTGIGAILGAAGGVLMGETVFRGQLDKIIELNNLIDEQKEKIEKLKKAQSGLRGVLMRATSALFGTEDYSDIIEKENERLDSLITARTKILQGMDPGEYIDLWRYQRKAMQKATDLDIQPKKPEETTDTYQGQAIKEQYDYAAVATEKYYDMLESRSKQYQLSEVDRIGYSLFLRQAESKEKVMLAEQEAEERIKAINEAGLAEEKKASEIQKVYAELAAAKKRSYQESLENLQKSLDEALALEQKYAEQVKQLKQELADLEMSLQDKIRALRQRDMGDAERQADLAAQAQEKMTAAIEAMKGGDNTLARQLSQQAGNIAYGLTDTKTAIDLLTQAADIEKSIIQGQITEAEDNMKKAQTIAEQVQGIMDEVRTGVEGKPIVVKFEADTSDIDAVLKRLNSLQDRGINLNARAGNVPGYSTGTFLPGYGGGDRIMSLLEAGEVVIRKEAVRRFGVPFFAALNSLQLPRYSTGGLAGSGAFASNAGTPTDTVNLNLNIGGNVYKATTSRNTAEEIKRTFGMEYLKTGGRRPSWEC